MKEKKIIYHILTLEDLQKQIQNNHYLPAHFENDGFIHCTAEISTSLLVLEDYFGEISKNNEIVILEIDTEKVTSKVKFEAPAPIEGGGTNHLKEGLLFPHIYGSLNIDAVTGVGKVQKEDNRFIWPLNFTHLHSYL